MTDRNRLTLARWIFVLAGVYGLIAFANMVLNPPPALNGAAQQQPEMFWGFVTVGVAWQIVFLLIGSDPGRYRPLMPVAAVFEKFSFVIIVAVLIARGIAPRFWIGPAVMDGVLGVAFLIAFVLTASTRFAADRAA